MRVLFTSSPLFGHINPLWRYADALRGAGHEVRFATTEAAREAVEKRDFKLVPLAEASAEDTNRVMAMLDACSAEEAPELAIREIFGGVHSRAALASVLEEIENWEADLVVRESTEFSGLVAAELAGVPSVALSILASGAMQRHGDCFQETANLLRDFAGMPSGRKGHETVFADFPASLDEDAPVLGVSPVRVAPSGPVRTPVVDGARWVPGDGERFVYVTFGTVSGRSDKAKAAYALALKVVADLPVRVLLTTGPIMDPALLGRVPDNVTVETYVPQAEVFSRADAVVHHGGSGTYLGTMAAGLPQVVVPLFADQPHNATAIEAAGAGVAVFDREEDVLRAAILRALDDDAMRENAEALAREMAAMTPVTEAVTIMEGLAREATGRMVDEGLSAGA